MPVYYFNLRAEESAEIDLVGRRCRDAQVARWEAAARARQVVRARLAREDATLNGWIEVEDEENRPVLRVPLRAAAC
ncbi:MAG: DUF6894 family protein [Allosphingosinicella sp.]|uniref:DUF6894 family protein n=1 Tax=Allosphingosinicella sp. TaxID=2823234 RepID=UPI00392D2720